MAKRTSAPRKSKTAQTDEELGLASLLARIERIQALFHEEAPDEDRFLLPDVDVVARVVRREYATLNGADTDGHQQIMRNGIRMSFEAMGLPEASGPALELLEAAFASTEDLAIRSAYFVGLSRGIGWTLETKKRLPG